MIRNMVFHISVVLLITGCGKDEEGIENRSPNGILIEVEAPQTNGWSTEEVTGTRSGMAKTVRQKGEYGVDMEVSTQHCPAGTATEGASTRWANVDDNITFRVVAYKSATAPEFPLQTMPGMEIINCREAACKPQRVLSSLWGLIHLSFIHTATQAPSPPLPTVLQASP